MPDDLAGLADEVRALLEAQQTERDEQLEALRDHLLRYNLGTLRVDRVKISEGNETRLVRVDFVALASTPPKSLEAIGAQRQLTPAIARMRGSRFPRRAWKWLAST